MSKALTHAKIVPRRSSDRGHANHGWLDTYHTFSFANYYNPKFESFGSLRVLNEDRVAPQNGFPTHTHRDAEIFSYILSGELTHRDSMIKKGSESASIFNDTKSNDFYRMHRGDVQFTTGGRGISHSETNESKSEWVHFLQIWALPWKKGLTPRYHTQTFPEAEKRKAFVPIISPLKAGPGASKEQEDAAEPAIPGTIPVHADLVMGAAIIPSGSRFEWVVGGHAPPGSENVVRKSIGRRVYVHFPMTKGGKASVKIDGRQDVVLKEGDGAFVEGVRVGDCLGVESLGGEEAEVVVLDSD